MSKANHFDICKVMAARNLDISMSPLENVTNVSYSQRMKGTTVSIGIDGNLVVAIGIEQKFVGGLLLCDRKQYYEIANELEHQIAPTVRDAIILIEKIEECDGMPAKLTLLRNFILFAAGRLSDWP